MILRIFDTAMDPDDVDRATELFRSEIKPVFDGFDGCHGIEMSIGVEEHSGDLVDVASVSRWDSLDAIEAATASDEYKEAMAELKKLFQRAPIIRHFEVLV
jgi:heme-degrading monooxygenase HmoA